MCAHAEDDVDFAMPLSGHKSGQHAREGATISDARRRGQQAARVTGAGGAGGQRSGTGNLPTTVSGACSSQLSGLDKPPPRELSTVGTSEKAGVEV